jgi:hypothetical protein
MFVLFARHLHPLGESRYGVDCTFVAAHVCVAYMDVGEGREHGAVSFTTPWNRITIPRHCALTCTATNAHSAPSN